jgi:hypothetical protein
VLECLLILNLEIMKENETDRDNRAHGNHLIWLKVMIPAVVTMTTLVKGNVETHNEVLLVPVFVAFLLYVIDQRRYDKKVYFLFKFGLFWLSISFVFILHIYLGVIGVLAANYMTWFIFLYFLMTGFIVHFGLRNKEK